MKKQQIAEAAYVLGAVLCIGICIGSGKDREKEVMGAVSASPTPVILPTAIPEKFPTETPDNVPELTSAPVKDTVPTPELSENTTPTPEGAKNVTPVPSGQPTGESTADRAETSPDSGEKDTTVTSPPEQEEIPGRLPGALEIKNANYEQYNNDTKAWWFIRNKQHKPSGSGEEFPISEYSAYYLDKNADESDKVIYLTFDCGYENGFTPAILDTLAEKDVKAMFFVTKDFIVKNPEYVKRMKEEGHLVGNHTVRHLSSPTLTPEELEAELREVARVMEEKTGYKIDPFFRPPMGEYSERTLKATQDMGYASIFWSIAYYDYDVNDQPGKDYVTDHFATYHHNGTIVLMHNTSESNAQALPEVVDNLKAEGYRFAPLTELVK